MGESDTNSGESIKIKKPKDQFLSPENLRSLAVLIFLIFCFRWSVASPYHVPTASMEPTIKVGDRLLAWKLSYGLKIPFTDKLILEWDEPKRGDIIVFRYPDNPDIDYVKRVVGLAGDRIKIIDDILYINDVPQPRQSHDDDRTILADIHDNAAIKQLYREQLGSVDHWVMQNIPAARNFFSKNWPPSGEFVVPHDSLFVMGDNRDNSTDSRVWEEVPMSYVRGKALFVLWSMASFPSFRWQRFFNWLD